MLQTDPILLPTDSVPMHLPSAKAEIEMLRNMSFDEFIDKASSSLVTFVINLAIAIVVFYAGKYLIRKIHNVVRTIMIKRHVDQSLTTFVLSLIRILLYFLLVVTVIGILGIETSSFIALFASAGVAIGMALSGTLQNFAGGVLILLLKPYKVGDFIDAQGYLGTVTEIQIFHTIINTPDNKAIIIPNGGLSTGSINNYSREEYRRIDWTIAISYGDDVDVARRVILDIFASDSRVVKNYIEDDKREREEEALEAARVYNELPVDGRHHTLVYKLFHRHRKKVRKRLENINDGGDDTKITLFPKVDRQPVVWVSQLGDSSVNLTARCWSRNEFYWTLFFSLNERFYKELPEHGIHFPFPQMDVHLSQKQ